MPFYEHAGAEVRNRMAWNGAERADVFLGPVQITLFTRAIYEDSVALPAEGFLHPALFTDALDAELAGHDVVWGPEIVEGPFGRRRIAFVSAPAESGSSSWSSSRRAPHEDHPLPPRVGELQRRVA